jgi:hypothetical protein
VSTDFDARLSAASRRGRSYRSAHHYSLQQFGLDAQAVIKEFPDAFESFDFDPVGEACGTAP